MNKHVTPSRDTQPVAPLKKRPAARTADKGTSRRGFAAMDPAEQRRLASEGGKASHASGRRHQWTAEEASAAGRKGGQISRRGPASK